MSERFSDNRDPRPAKRKEPEDRSIPKRDPAEKTPNKRDPEPKSPPLDAPTDSEISRQEKVEL